MTNGQIILCRTEPSEAKKCLACGAVGIKARRRYCSNECREHMMWVLSLSKGLLKVFNARYAAFSFNKGYLVLDVLPIWSKEISRFLFKRRLGKKPAEDLKTLILRSAEEWYHMINNRNSRSYASLLLLRKNHSKGIAPESIRPGQTIRPRLSKDEKKSIKFLELKIEALLSDGHVEKIRSSYKKLAKIYHPDVGGDAEKFKKLNEAHQQILVWAEKPQFTSRKALPDCWSYDGFTNKWSPPL
ncbi:MAG: DnaJ domain-containing protein [Desulfobacterales bacterium]|nr:DnaJ domain-containing protein [Desulfobacterales bacterium]